MDSSFSSIEEAIQDLREGKMVIVLDDDDRENEGDLIAAAEKITPETINFMATHGRGLICMPITEEKAAQLKLENMTKQKDRHGTNFTVSIDHKETTTGISAQDRALTIQKAAADATPDEFFQPGHVFPLIAKTGGVLHRAGHTEAAVDLMLLAGRKPIGVICEIMKEDGQMARLNDLIPFAQKHHLRLITIADLIRYRMTKEKLVERIATIRLPTHYGIFTAYGYKDTIYGEEYIALVMGDTKNNPLVRVHSACLTGDVFGSQRCDCGPQLSKALEMIAKEKRGVLLYIQHHEGRGIGLLNKLRAYELQEKGRDTVQANTELGFKPDLRDYGTGAQILADLGITSMRLLTNNPKKIVSLEGYGLTITERVPIQIPSNDHNTHYLFTKCTKLGHLLDLSKTQS